MNTTTNIDEQVKQILREKINIYHAVKYDIFIVWKCKTLQHCKWLMATTLPDNFVLRTDVQRIRTNFTSTSTTKSRMSVYHNLLN